MKQNKTAKFEAYRKYCNKIVNFLKSSRHSYYQNIFEQKKHNTKILQQGINNIIHSEINETSTRPLSLTVDKKHMTPPPPPTPQDMVEHFNNF